MKSKLRRRLNKGGMLSKSGTDDYRKRIRDLICQSSPREWTLDEVYRELQSLSPASVRKLLIELTISGEISRRWRKKEEDPDKYQAEWVYSSSQQSLFRIA